MDERVEYAIQQLWLDSWNGNGAEAKKKLEEAVEDGNAYYYDDCIEFLGIPVDKIKKYEQFL